MPARIIIRKPGSRMTFEYSLVGGVNDHRGGREATVRLWSKPIHMSCKSDSCKSGDRAELCAAEKRGHR